MLSGQHIVLLVCQLAVGHHNDMSTRKLGDANNWNSFWFIFPYNPLFFL